MFSSSRLFLTKCFVPLRLIHCHRFYSVGTIDKSFLARLQDTSDLNSESYSPEKEEALYLQLSQNENLLKRPDVQSLIQSQWKGKCTYSPLFEALLERENDKHKFISMLKQASQQNISLGKLYLGQAYLSGLEDGSGNYILDQDIELGLKLVKEVADTDFSAAQFTYYKLLKQEGFGNFSNEDREKTSLHYLELAATGSHPLPAAQTELGIYLIENFEETTRGVSFLKDAIANGDVRADVYLAGASCLNHRVKKVFMAEIPDDPSVQPEEYLMENLKKANDTLKKYCELGNPEAWRYVGRINLNSHDYKAATECFLKAVEKGDAESYRSLQAIAFATAQTPEERAKGFEYAKKGAELGSVECEADYAFHLVMGNGCEKNGELGLQILEKLMANKVGRAFYNMALISSSQSKEFTKESQEYMKKASDLKFPQAMFEYGKSIFNPEGSEREKVESVGLMVEASNSGCSDASLFLGSNMMNDKPEVALGFISQGSADGNLQCMSMLGLMLIRGIGVGSPQIEQGRLLCLKASEYGDAFATFNVGMMYITGEGVKQDAAAGVKYLKESLKKNPNIAEAHYTLFRIYREGAKGIPSNKKLAFTHIERAAILTDFSSCWHEYSKMLFNGEGVNSDPEKAISILQLSADAGYKPSQKLLSEIYAVGANGIKKDEVEAEKWRTRYEQEKE